MLIIFVVLILHISGSTICNIGDNMKMIFMFRLHFTLCLDYMGITIDIPNNINIDLNILHGINIQLSY